MRVDVRQARYPDLASETTGFIQNFVQTNSSNGNAALDQGRLHRQRTSLRLCHSAVKSSQAPGRKRFPLQGRRASLAQGFVQIVKIDGLPGAHGVSGEDRLAIPDGFPATPTVFSARPDDAQASSQLCSTVGTYRLQHLQAIAQLNFFNGG